MQHWGCAFSVTRHRCDCVLSVTQHRCGCVISVTQHRCGCTLSVTQHRCGCALSMIKHQLRLPHNASLPFSYFNFFFDEKDKNNQQMNDFADVVVQLCRTHVHTTYAYITPVLMGAELKPLPSAIYQISDTKRTSHKGKCGKPCQNDDTLQLHTYK